MISYLYHPYDSGPGGLVQNGHADAMAGLAHVGAAVPLAMVALRRDRDMVLALLVVAVALLAVALLAVDMLAVALLVVAVLAVAVLVVAVLVVAVLLVVRSRGHNLPAVVVFGGLGAEAHFSDSRGGDDRYTKLLGTRDNKQRGKWMTVIRRNENGMNGTEGRQVHIMEPHQTALPVRPINIPEPQVICPLPLPTIHRESCWQGIGKRGCGAERSQHIVCH